MNSRGQFQLPWFCGYIGCMPITLHLPISTIPWLAGPATAVFVLWFLKGFYWLSKKTLIQQMIITYFVCIELEHKAANASKENTQSSSVKAFYLFICSHAVYKPMSIIIRWIMSLYFALRPCFQKKQMAETDNSFWRRSSPYACTVMRPSKSSEQKG